jgi:hypothetical protein
MYTVWNVFTVLAMKAYKGLEFIVLVPYFPIYFYLCGFKYSLFFCC